MNILVVGLSHYSAPVSVLERAAVRPPDLGEFLHDACGADGVSHCFALSTCHRAEVYAQVGAFHSAVTGICDVLASYSGLSREELTPYLYVHYGDRAVQHLIAVACGLDSMVVGESQILGQVRAALKVAAEQGTLGRVLSELGSSALRAGKRAHAETRIGRAGASVVSVGLAAAARQLAGEATEEPTLTGHSVLVVGAGSMSSLAVAAAAKAGADRVAVASRTVEHAARLAASVGGRHAAMTELPAFLAAADLVVACTGAAGHVISADMVSQALLSRDRPTSPTSPLSPLVLLDLALPRDIEPAAGELPGAVLINLDNLTTAAAGRTELPHEAEIAAVRRIVNEALSAYLLADRAASVAPTVAALRAKAEQVVEFELARLTRRLDYLDAAAQDEISRAMHRVADKLLHSPTVRVKELAGSPGAGSYETALRVLFDLDTTTVQAVTTADADITGAATGAGVQAGPRWLDRHDEKPAS